MNTPIRIAGDATLLLSITRNLLGISELPRSRMLYFERMPQLIGILRQLKMVAMVIGSITISIGLSREIAIGALPFQSGDARINMRKHLLRKLNCRAVMEKI